MTIKIDIKLLIGLAVGVLVGGLIAGGVAVALSGNDKKGNTSAAGGGGNGSENGNGNDEGGGGDNGTASGAAPAPPPSVPVPAGVGKVTCPRPTKTVSSAKDLQAALASAQPGDVIRIAPGTYEGKFVAQNSGTKDKPIFVCGDATSILDGGGVKKGYAFHLDKASYWRLVGFTVRNSQKGVMADTTEGSIIQGLTVHDIGDEAIHLRNFSSGNIVQYCKIYNTGLRRAKFGEGVYLGTAQSNWKSITGGRMDRSDNNIVRGNVIRATAEAVDIKEGTTGGRILDNVFDGSALGGDKHNDSWVDVKGNNYLIEGNKGTKTLADGYQTHDIVKGWGTGNVFRGNTIDLGGGNGVGINDTVGGNTIGCDNKMQGGGRISKDGNCS
jgi:hypothetical protein